MYTEAEARKLVVEAGRMLVDKKLIARTWGNISARIGNDTFVITPSGRSYELLRPEDMVVVRISDLTYEGDIEPSSEKGVHAAAYDLRPDVNFIIHTHQFYASVIAAECRTSWVAPCGAYALPGTAKLIKHMREVISHHPEENAFLMARHGALILGKDMNEAFERADKLECDSKKLFDARVPAHGLTRRRKVDIDKTKLKRRHKYFVVESDPYIMECCTNGMVLRPFIDDFAMIAGADVICVPNKIGKIRKGLHNRNAVLVDGVGAVCTGITPADAEAVAMILSKNAAAHCYVRRAMPLSKAEAVLQRSFYTAKYSKRKEESLHTKKSSSRTMANIGKSIMLRDTSGDAGSFIGVRKLNRKWFKKK